MKRDMDLVRKLIFAIEDRPPDSTPDRLEVEGYTDVEVGYHLSIMLEADLIHGFDSSTRECALPQAVASSLTWAGHEFADAARNESLWNQTKKAVREKVGSTTIGVLTNYLQNLARSMLGL